MKGGIPMTMDALTTILLLALVVEFATEIIKSLFHTKKGLSKALAILLGMILCVSTRTGLLRVFGLETFYPLVDYLVTGLIISRGSNIIHDLFSRLSQGKTNMI
jgi:hypothetical protein